MAEVSLTVDLRAELGTGESLRPLASDLAREEEEERREAEQGGSTCQDGIQKDPDKYPHPTLKAFHLYFYQERGAESNWPLF